MLTRAREEAEKEAVKSEKETEKLIENYGRVFDERKNDAVRKAVELVLQK